MVSVEGSPNQGRLSIWTMNIPVEQADRFEEFSAHIVIPGWSGDLSQQSALNNSQTISEILPLLRHWEEWLLRQEDQERNGNRERGLDEDSV